jgi:hypothetical protein
MSRYFVERGASVLRSDRWCRPDARRLDLLGFLLALAGLDLLLLTFRPWLFGRGWIWAGESGGPPLFAPFLKVEGNTGHLKTPGLSPSASTLGILKGSGAHKGTVLRFVLAPSGSHHRQKTKVVIRSHCALPK